jgi:hypothetical protein
VGIKSRSFGDRRAGQIQWAKEAQIKDGFVRLKMSKTTLYWEDAGLDVLGIDRK